MDVGAIFCNGIHVKPSCLRPCTAGARPALLAQAWVGLAQMVQCTLFVSMYEMSPAQARSCLRPILAAGLEANYPHLPNRERVWQLAVFGLLDEYKRMSKSLQLHYEIMNHTSIS